MSPYRHPSMLVAIGLCIALVSCATSNPGPPYEQQVKSRQLSDSSNESVRVSIVQSSCMEVVVGGAVVKSGNTQLTEHSSVFQAVYEAGVVDQTNLRRVYVIRDDGERLKVTEVDFHRMIDEGDTRLNLELQSGDVVYVSYTR